MNKRDIFGIRDMKTGAPEFMIMNDNIEGAPKQLGRLGFCYVPETLKPKGRRLQILVRMQGSRPDKPHDVWYVIQIVQQSHRGTLLAPKARSKYYTGGSSWVFRTKDGTRVMLHSSTDSKAATPRIWTAHDGTIHFNTWNAMGTLDNIPMIIDEREYKAVKEAVEAYNEKFAKDDPMEVPQL